MPLPKLDQLFTRQKRNPFLEALDLPHFLICLLVIAAYVLLLFSGKLERVENSFLDFYFRQRSSQTAHPAIAIVEIDKDSLEAIGPFPWPWSYHAQLIEILNKWQSKAIVLDFMLREANIPEEEAKLVKVLEKTSNVYFPVSFESKLGKKIWIHGMPIELEPDNEKKAWVHSHPSAEKFAKSVGHKNVAPDEDGVIRRVDPYVTYEGQSYFYLPLLAGSDWMGESLTSGMDLKFPLDAHNRLLINWPGKWQDNFKHYSYADIVRSAQAIEKGLTPVISPSKFKGKICLVGLTDPQSGEFKASPLESASPTLGVHAAVLNSLLQQQFIRPVSLMFNILSLCLIGFLAAVLFVIFGNVASFVATLVLGFAWVAVAFFMFIQYGVWIYSFHPLILILTLFIVSAIFHQLRSRREETRLFNLATRDGLTGLFVIRHFRDILNQAVEDAREKKQPLSIILMDIDNFKKINDTYGHPAGDMVLKRTAQIVSGCFRSNRPLHEIDFAARYGGEEFIVMVRNADLKNAGLHVAERIRKAIEMGDFNWEGNSLIVTVSVGVSTLHPGEKIPDVMVRRADEALYRAKKSGKNRVCLETFAGA